MICATTPPPPLSLPAGSEQRWVEGPGCGAGFGQGNVRGGCAPPTFGCLHLACKNQQSNTPNRKAFQMGLDFPRCFVPPPPTPQIKGLPAPSFPQITQTLQVSSPSWFPFTSGSGELRVLQH